jgi:flagellar protein FlaF
VSTTRINQIQLYASVEAAALSGRELEASVLIRAAARLKGCQDNWMAGDRDEKLRDALELTQKVWSVFQAELARPDHPLPVNLRQDILQLSLFIDKRIFEMMAFPSPDKLTAIIEINRSVAAGLRGSPE